jgi:hypothetical protein
MRRRAAKAAVRLQQAADAGGAAQGVVQASANRTESALTRTGASPKPRTPSTVRCLRPLDSHRHVMRADAATIYTHSYWASVTEPLKLGAVAGLLHQIQVKSKARS